ncbi:MAG: TIM barrel protein [Clostridia bacterium]|jgi:deoxyribonuclease-4|nr:TIM barrel protein [Clostridia bacterium]
MIKFGPSGNCESFYAEGNTHTEQAAAFVKNRGLDCFEYSFGRGVRMTEDKAISIGEAFREEEIELSVHAPYYINFANPDDEMAQKSYGYVLDSGKMLKAMGGTRCVFHPAAQGKDLREQAVARTAERLKVLRDYLYLNDLQDLKFCPETMGKIAQIGTVEEITAFCEIDPIFTPCVDFGHVNAREQGSLKTSRDYKDRLEYMIERLGYDRMKHFHVHFSKIMYSVKGEVKHLTLEDTVYGPEFEPLAQTLCDLKLEPYIVSESDGTQAEDALIMKRIYERVKKGEFA